MKEMFVHFEDLKNQCLFCNKCPLSKNRTKCVFGQGDLNANLMLIAEAPGYEEDKQGVPFVGKAGKLLDSVLEELNILRSEIYISNICKCRPPQNRNPQPNEINSCLDYLRNEVILIKPKVIVLLGSVALKTILGEEYFITKCNGQIIKKRGITYIPTYHPSAVLRDNTKLPSFKKALQTAYSLCK